MNIISLFGWVIIISTLITVFTNFVDFWSLLTFYFYNAILFLVLTLIIFSIELFFWGKYKKRILTINIKNIFLKVIYYIIFYGGIIGLFYFYYILWEYFLKTGL